MEKPSQNQLPAQQQQHLQGVSLRYPQQAPIGLAPHQQYQVDMFWKNQNQEVAHMVDFKYRQLPVTRIKRVMKAEPDVKMVSSEAPVVIAKACEMFIQDLTLRAWLNAVENNTCTIDIVNLYDAIRISDAYEFLLVTNSNKRSKRNSSEVRTQSSYSSVGDGNQPIEVNHGVATNEEPLEQSLIQSPAKGTIKNPYTID